MKICLFVHEFLPQIGHSKAMIEMMNGLLPEQKKQVLLIEVVSCQCADLNLIFEEFSCPKRFIKIPGKSLKPFIIKMLNYHTLSLFYSWFFCKNKIKIGIGIACLNVNISNVQFIHEQWKPLFFSKRNLTFLPLLYKKILFKYFEIGERILFSNKKTTFIVIAHFMNDFLISYFKANPDQLKVIPSGVNPEEFSIPTLPEEEIIQTLTTRYPELNKIDFNFPVALFIGAFERKGLDRVLKYLQNKKNSQIIIIGKPESYSKWIFPKDITIALIPFTTEANLFYSISDIFIFPTYYEPFGLVILEAYAMGLDLIIPKNNVGASEILTESEGIYLFQQEEDLPQLIFKKIQRVERIKRREERLKNLTEFTWKKSSQQFYSTLSKY